MEAPILVPLDSKHSTTPVLLPLPSTLQSSPSAQAYPPGDVNPTSVSSLQPANGTSVKVLTVPGRVTSVKAVQLLKARFPITSPPSAPLSFIINVLRLVQPSNS